MMKALAWVSFAGAIVAGAGLAATALGLMQVVLVIGLIVALVLDIAKDRTPSLEAVFVAMFLPTLLHGMGGDGAETIRDWYDHAWSAASGRLGSLLGTTTLIGLAIAVAVASVMIARSTMPRTGSTGSIRTGGLRPGGLR